MLFDWSSKKMKPAFGIALASELSFEGVLVGEGVSVEVGVNVGVKVSVGVEVGYSGVDVSVLSEVDMGRMGVGVDIGRLVGSHD
jgi:hypothetical protein